MYNLHSGHRKRLKEKFKKNGIDSFNDHEILELLLFWAVPRKDTNQLAHRLINKFGSISSVLDAPIKLLTEINGIGESCALFLKLIPNMARVYEESKHLIGRKVPSLEECCYKLVRKFLGRIEEAVAIMLFDSKGKIIYDGIINKGSVNAVGVYSRKVVELISHYFATSLILAHNHPSGMAIPSGEDIRSTDHIYEIISGMKVILIDHIIVADGDYVSMRDCKLGKAFSEE